MAVLAMEEAEDGGFPVEGCHLQADPVSQVVIKEEAGGSENVPGPEFQQGSAVALEVLDPAGKQALAERGREALSAKEADPAVAVVQARPVRAGGNAQALEFPWQSVSFEWAAFGNLLCFLIGQFRSWNGNLRMPSSVRQSRPVVVAPFDPLHGRFAAEGAEAPVPFLHRAGAEVGEVPFAGRQLQKRSMPRLLQRLCGILRTGENGVFRMHLPPSFEAAAAGHGDGVIPSGSAFRTDKEIPVAMAEKMRPFGHAKFRAREEQPGLAEEAVGAGIVLLDENAVEGVLLEGIPTLAEDVLSPVRVVEQGGIKAAGVQKDRFCPRPVDGRGTDKEIARVFEAALEVLHVGVDQPEIAVVPAQGRSPDAPAAGNAEKIEKAATVQWAGAEAPVAEIAAVVDTDARKPLEGAGGKVEVIAGPAEAGVGVKTGKNRVGQVGGHGAATCGSGEAVARFCMLWNGKTAIITGANSGIGKAIAGACADMGMQLVLTGRRQEKNEAVARELERSYGTGVLPLQCDVSREQACRELVATAGRQFGRIDVMVNNAGMGAMGTRIADSDTELFDKVMRTNLYSAYWCSREAWKWMERNETEDADALRGAILNISSVCGVDAWAGTGLYAASKHGMMGLTKALADEGVQPRIRAAAICPAMVATAMTGVSGSDYIDPADIAATARYLLELKAAAWPTEVVVNRRGAA